MGRRLLTLGTGSVKCDCPAQVAELRLAGTCFCPVWRRHRRNGSGPIVVQTRSKQKSPVEGPKIGRSSSEKARPPVICRHDERGVESLEFLDAAGWFFGRCGTRGAGTTDRHLSLRNRVAVAWSRVLGYRASQPRQPSKWSSSECLRIAPTSWRTATTRWRTGGPSAQFFFLAFGRASHRGRPFLISRG